MMVILRRPHPWFLTVAFGLALLAGWLIGAHGLFGAAVVIAALLVLIVWSFPETAFVVSILTIIVGQLIRLPINGGENSVLINDVLLPPLLVVWTWRRLASRHWTVPRTSLTMPAIAMIGAMILSLLFNVGRYSQTEMLSGALFLIRWIEYAALLVVGYEFVRTRVRAQRYLELFVWTGVFISILGFIQLRIYPDFSFMVPKGWDPHIGRLLSTWFDPNFLGGYLALLVTICLGVALSKEFVAARWWWVAITIMTMAIVLTFSRSGYVALALGAGLVTLFRSRTIFFLGIMVFLGVILFVPRVQERVVGIRTIDETAKLRLVSWSNAWAVISDHFWWGVGYNLYPRVQVDYGFQKTAAEHSASGSDSSLLTIWVTTGVVGFAMYWWLLVAIAREVWKTWRDKNLSPHWRGYGLGLLAGLAGLFLHSQFVNSLLYPHIMEPLWILLAIAIMVRQPSTTTTT